MHEPLFDCSPIGKTAKRLKVVWIGFATAKAKRGSNVEREQMAAMWLAGRSGPAVAFQHLDDLQVFRKTIAMDGIEQQNIAIRSKTAVSDQVARISKREECLPGGEWRVVHTCDLCLSVKIKRVTHVLEPLEFVGFQFLCCQKRRL